MKLDQVIAAWPLERYARAKRRDLESIYQFLQSAAPGRDFCSVFPAPKWNVAR